MTKLKYAQDLIKASPSVMAGFNTFINGGESPKHPDYGDKNEWYASLKGYNYARQMSKDEGIAFKHPFKCTTKSKCHPFSYGGSFVCNHCNKSNVDFDWWNIQVEKDGNEYCCHGLDFVNLQESDNYAFGKTYEDAIKKYGILMISKS